MSTYEVTLTQKSKVFIEAETPGDAVTKAMDNIKKDNEPFTPTNWTVKEKAEGE